MNKDVAIRAVAGSDIPFIYATMLNSLRVDSILGRTTRKSIFYNHYNPIVDAILMSSKVLIACLPQDKNVILGYMIYKDDTLHYTFVKEAFRRMGIASELHAQAGSPRTITHQTETSQPILTKHPDRFVFNPFLLFAGHSRE